MRCPSCEVTISTSTRFGPSCGTLLDANDSAGAAATTSVTRGGAAAGGDGAATQSMPAPRGPSAPRTTAPPTAPIPVAGVAASAPPTAPTQPTPALGADRGPASRPAPGAPNQLRARIDAGVEQLQVAPVEVRAALAGAAIVLLGFLLLPYAVSLGTGVTAGGRVWWRPITAVLTAVLLAVALRRADAVASEDLDDPYPVDTPGALGTTADRAVRNHRLLVVAVVVATVGATEGGLLGLVSGGNDRLRAGYYVMLLGSVVVAAAAIVAALRRSPR